MRGCGRRGSSGESAGPGSGEKNKAGPVSAKPQRKLGRLPRWSICPPFSRPFRTPLSRRLPTSPFLIASSRHDREEAIAIPLMREGATSPNDTCGNLRSLYETEDISSLFTTLDELCSFLTCNLSVREIEHILLQTFSYSSVIIQNLVINSRRTIDHHEYHHEYHFHSDFFFNFVFIYF